LIKNFKEEDKMENLKLWLRGVDRSLLVKIAGGSALLLLIIFYTLNHSEAEAERPLTETASEGPQENEADLTEQGDIKVDIKGEVVYPGVYKMEEGQRVEQVIKEAGGLTEEADIAGVNLAQRAFDEMVINVPAVSTSEVTGESGEPSQEDNARLNMNMAEQAEWETLPGIGPAKAEAIVSYREETGPFQQVDDLINVPGIGEKTLETLREYLSTY
jgi:competence protein ComEA